MNALHSSSPGDLRFDDDGLVPVVAQDAETGVVLMVAFMNETALIATRTTGRAHYWSRSRARLWRKGERSGHEQAVDAILVNCERNSLLLRVRQIGAVCHDGYSTCFYRRLEANGALALVEQRSFDPTTVYTKAGDGPAQERLSNTDDVGFASRTAVAYGAYAELRDHHFNAVSETSRRLHPDAGDVSPRISDELRELAGVLAGTHLHVDRAADALLEGTQVWYWIVLAALRAGLSWEEWRPDQALATANVSIAPDVAVRLLSAEADRWAASSSNGSDIAAKCHTTLALVALACHAAGVDPPKIVDADLSSLHEKPYLAHYFLVADALSMPYNGTR